MKCMINANISNWSSLSNVVVAHLPMYWEGELDDNDQKRNIEIII